MAWRHLSHGHENVLRVDNVVIGRRRESQLLAFVWKSLPFGSCARQLSDLLLKMQSLDVEEEEMRAHEIT